jgi:CheY-like chemotaxis protein
VHLAQWVQDNGFALPGAIMSGHLKSFPDLPANWQSVQKPVRLADLRMLLAAGRRDEQAPPGKVLLSQPPLSAPTILVVEDNDGMRFVVAEMLRRSGFNTVEAGTAGDALQCLNEDPSIRLVVSDLGLPDRPGGQLAQEVGHQHPGVAVVLMSGTSSPPELKDGLPDAGAVLQKPFSREALTSLVEEALARTQH